tara:strand:+ start:58 stop:375 length:318 start_codon:yes stop_codon:yes gene_type:complete
MKNLENDLFDALFGASLIIQENCSWLGCRVNRFCLDTEITMSSMRKNLQKLGLGSFESMLKKADRKKLISLVLDDGTLHISLPLSMHTEEQLQRVEQACDFKKLK